MKHLQRLAASILVAATTTVAGCSDERTSPTPVSPAAPDAPALARVAATPAQLVVGEVEGMVSYSTFAQNKIAEGFTLTWKTTAAGVVSVDAAGMATAKAVGSAKVIVTAGKRADSISVTVTAPVLASLTLSAASTALTVGQTESISVLARDTRGLLIPTPTLTFSSSAASVATVSQAGVVTAVGAGSSVITATSGSVSGSLSFSITAPSSPPPAPPPSGSTVTPPTRPQLLTYNYPASTGKSWVVKPTDNLQTILNSAQRGDQIILPAGATFTGNFVLPAKSGSASNGWIIIRSDKTLPPQGTRVTPAHASLFPRIVTDNVSPALATAASASGWWISGVEISVAASVTAINYGLVSLGDGSAKQTSLSQVPQDIVIERSYVHGLPSSNVSRCIALNSGRAAILDSYIHECHLKGYDSQAIAGWNGPGPFKIVNNTLAGAGENVMFGGSDPKIPNLIPSDIEIRRNYIYTPASWKGKWTKKNIIESKNSQRVLVEGNVLEGSWTDGQVGFAVVLKSANQSGGCKWCATRDWEFRNNIVRNVGAGFNLSGREGSNPHPVGELLTRVWLEQNIVENVNTGIYTGDKKMVQLLQNLSNLTLRNNSFYSTAQFSSVLAIGSSPAATHMEMTGNAAHYGGYGLFATQTGPGEVSLGNISGTVNFGTQVFVGAQKNGYPRATFVSSVSAVPSTRGASTAIVNAATAGVVIP